jgi:general L-amino acid transport system permease protein
VAIVLALGRQSEMPVLRWASVGYIEICRGLPLIAVLFMARILLPYAFPVGAEFDPLALAVVGIILFESAYLAEVFRGGFQAIQRARPRRPPRSGLATGELPSTSRSPKCCASSFPASPTTPSPC